MRHIIYCDNYVYQPVFIFCPIYYLSFLENNIDLVISISM